MKYTSLVVLIFCKITIVLLPTLLFAQKANQNPNDFASQKAALFLKELQIYYSKGNYEMHKVYSDSLLHISQEYDLVKMNVLAFTNQAVYYSNRGERLKAIELYHKALKKCDNIPEDFRSRIIVLINMGNTYNNIGSYDKAIEYMQKVIHLLDVNENSDKIRAAALIGISNSYVKLGDFKQTIDYSKKARLIGEKINDKNTIITSTNNTVDALIHLKDYESALKLGQKVVALTEGNQTKKRAWALLNQGVINYHIGDSDKALDYLLKCVLLSKEKKLLEIEMLAHKNLASVYEQKNNYKLSVLEQKKYIAIRELFLEDRKSASNADLNQVIDTKSKIIADNDKELKGFSRNRILILATSAILLVSLSGFLYFNIKRKKKLNSSSKKLQQQYMMLQNDFKKLKQKTEVNPEYLTSNSKNNSLKPYKNSSLTPEKRELYKSLILSYMTTKKPYLNPDMTQSNLASQIGISSHHFSEVLYYKMEQNFYNFINSYRILEAQKLMKKEENKDVKILAFAFDSGFKSKTSFNRAFKSHTGFTPSEYRKKIT